MLALVAIAAAAPSLYVGDVAELEEKYGSPIFEGRAGYENDCRREAERFDMVKKMGAKKMRKCIAKYKEGCSSCATTRNSARTSASPFSTR